jgi:hypothetical protein
MSNLPFIYTVLEKAVDMQLETHLASNKLHEPNQSAYRKFHSTESTLIKVQNDIMQSLDKNNITVLVLLDLSAEYLIPLIMLLPLIDLSTCLVLWVLR